MRPTHRPAPLRSRRTRGFTLIELMISIVVSSIVVLGVFAFSTIQQTTATMHGREVRVQQSLEGAMWSLGRDVRGAGLGFARFCTELRIWDNAGQRLINPGGAASASAAAKDPETGEAYWVLRDGIQVHWNSTGANAFPANVVSSGFPAQPADALDVVLAEPNYVQSFGVFEMGAPIAPGTPEVRVKTHPISLSSTNPDHLASVRQLFPPGSFFIVVPPPPTGLPFQAAGQRQCMLMQVTDDIAPGVATDEWVVPVGNTSGFNANLLELVEVDQNGPPTPDAEGFEMDDWIPDEVNIAGSSVIPLGRLRWSRYEIDYTVASLPYLVRRDIIGFKQGVDPENFGTAANYPHCDAGQCPAPGLHLPGSNDPPATVAIGPLVEDMQIAVGCDGYTSVAAQNAATPIPSPDQIPTAFDEVGPATGPNANQPNGIVDENPANNSRDRDEWLGNIANEAWAPDCVWYGAAQYWANDWGAEESHTDPPGNFRMSPQTLRITLVGTGEYESAAGGVSTEVLPALEDRAQMNSIISGARERFILTERFSPSNLRWRDTLIQ